MSERATYTLSLQGQKLTLVSSDGEEHVRRVASRAREALDAMRSPRLSSHLTALAATLSLAEENLALRDEITRLRAESLAEHAQA